MKTTKRIRNIIPLVLAVPFLMANSPRPAATTTNYEDFKVTTSYIGEIDIGEQRIFQYGINIENTGNSYLLMDDYLAYNNSGLSVKPYLFNSEVVAPGQIEDFIHESYGKMEFDDANDKWWGSTYYTKDENVTFSNISVVIDDRSNLINSYQIKADIANRGDYYYEAIVELIYDGDTYYIRSHISNNEMYFTTVDDIDLNKLTIKSMTAYRSSYETYKGGKVLAWIIYGFFGLIGLGILLIPPAIIIPVSIVKHKRRQRANQQKDRK